MMSPRARNNPLPAFPRNSGQYLDGFGNRVTVHAVYNPQQTAPEANHLLDRAPGFGIIEFDRAARAVSIALWPRRVDPRATGAIPAPGWPVHITPLDNGWSRCEWELPLQPAGAKLRDLCIEIHDEEQGEWLYTLRVPGDAFRAPVRHEGFYPVRVLDPDGKYQEERKHVRAVRRA